MGLQFCIKLRKPMYLEEMVPQALAKKNREIGSFEFDATITKAYERDGEMHVVAVPSDSVRDDQGDRISKGGLGRLAEQCQGGIDLLDNHRATFPFGKTTGDSHVQEEDGGGRLVVDVELDGGFPQSLALFKDVQAGTCEKQLSIGGKLNRANPDCIRYERDDGVRTRVIEDLLLDHIACTRKGKAANKRTSFLDAVLKAVDEVEAERGDIEKEGEGSMPTGTGSVEKKAVPFKKYPAHEGTGWSWGAAQGNALIDKGSWPMFKAAHAWYDDTEGETPESKAAYKLPHHVLEGGRLVTHWPGTSYAMAALLGARGGVAIPGGEKRGVYNHLAHHYRDAERTPPEFRMTGKVVTVKGKEVEAKDFKGDISEVDFEKTEFEPWSQDEFVKFHADQGMKMEWLTEEVWEEAIKDLSEERHTEAEAEWEKEKAEMEKAKVEAKVGFNFLRKIGKVLGVGSDEEKDEDLELTGVVKELVESIQVLEAHAEKAEFSEKDRAAINRMIGMVECSIGKIAKAAEVDSLLDLAMDDEKVTGATEKADSILDLADAKFTEDDMKALHRLHGTLKAMGETESEKGADGDDVTKEIPEDVFSDIVEKAMIVHRQMLSEKVEAVRGIANDIADNASSMTAQELKAKISQLSDISWSVRDLADVVNATREKMSEKEDGGKGDAEKDKKGGDDKGDVKDDALKALEENATSTVEWLKGLEKDKAKEYIDRVQAVIKSLTEAVPSKEGDGKGKGAGDDKDAGKGGDGDAEKNKDGDDISKGVLDGEIKKTREEITKDVEATMKGARDDITKEIEEKVVGAIGRVKEALDDVSGRLEKMEKVSGVSQGIAGSDDVTKGSKKKGDVWTGLFDGAISKASSKM